MKIELNIGLEVNGKETANYGPATVIREVVAAFNPSDIQAGVQVAKSGERTMVIMMHSDQPASETRINFICYILSQDAIAGKIDGEGFLFGPKREDYGNAFNPEFWLSPDALVPTYYRTTPNQPAKVVW